MQKFYEAALSKHLRLSGGKPGPEDEFYKKQISSDTLDLLW